MYYQEQISDPSCLCEKCENCKLLRVKIKKFDAQFISLPTLTKDILKLFCCDLENEGRINGTCSGCPNVEISRLNKIDEVLFYQSRKELLQKYSEKLLYIFTSSEVLEFFNT